MRSSAGPTPLGVLLIGVLLLAPIQAAHAGDEADELSPYPRRPLRTSEDLEEQQRIAQEWYEEQVHRALERFRPKPDRQVLLGVVEDGGQSKGSLSGRFRINLTRGIEYRQQFSVGSQRLKLKLYGPVVKGNPGLRLKLTGLTLRERPVEIKAFGNPEKGGFELKIDF